MGDEEIKIVINYIERMTKAEQKVREFEHAYKILKNQYNAKKFQLHGKKSSELIEAFFCAIDHILEV